MDVNITVKEIKKRGFGRDFILFMVFVGIGYELYELRNKIRKLEKEEE